MADTYYANRYGGEDTDNTVDKINDLSVENDALKAALDALTARVAALEGKNT